MVRGKGLGDVVHGENGGKKIERNGEMKTTYAAFFDGITVVVKSSRKQEFIERATPVLERFELEAFKEDVFPYDEREAGGWGDDDQSLEQFLSERGISLNGQVVVIVEDETEGTEIIVG